MYKSGDKVVFVRDASDAMGYGRGKYLNTIITLKTKQDHDFGYGAKEAWTTKEMDSWIIRDNEIVELEIYNSPLYKIMRED